MAVPNIFGTATAAIPLSQLDTNFATAITLGNTAVYLGNTTTSLGNVTLTNVTISSGNVTVTGANVSGTANVSTLIVTGNQTSLGNVTVTGNVSANIVTVAAGAVGTPSITTTGDTNTGIFFPAADTIAFAEGGAEAMRINSSGQVGIGTSSPDTPLTFAQSVSNKISLYQGTNWHIGMANYSAINVMEFASDAVGEDITFGYGAAGSITRNVTFKGTGDVGIGTSSPQSRLHVYTGASGVTPNAESKLTVENSGNAAFSILAPSANESTIYFGSPTSAIDGGVIYNHPARAMIFRTAGNTERMRIDSSGRVYSGSSTPWTVGGSGVNAWALYNGGDFPISAASQSTITAIFNRCTSTGTIVEFKYNANANGSVSTNGTNVAYNTSSDYRLKENIVPMTGALAKVAQLKPVTYKWKINGSDGEGFIAHELAQVKPDCVSGDKDATRQEEYEVTPAVKDEEGNITTPAVMGTRTVPVYQGVDTSFLVATLTSAIQELKALVDNQSSTITALTARITALEAK